MRILKTFGVQAGTIHGIEQNKKRRPNLTIDNYITAHLGIILISLLIRYHGLFSISPFEVPIRLKEFS